MPIVGRPTLIIFDEEASAGPLVESLTIVFERIEPVRVEVQSFAAFTLKRAEADQVPAYTPEWTDFNAGDPGITLGDAPLLDDLFL